MLKIVDFHKFVEYNKIKKDKMYGKFHYGFVCGAILPRNDTR